MPAVEVDSFWQHLCLSSQFKGVSSGRRRPRSPGNSLSAPLIISPSLCSILPLLKIFIYCLWSLSSDDLLLVKIFSASTWSVHFLSGSFKFALSSICSIQLCMLSLGTSNCNSWVQSVGINQVVGSACFLSMSAQPCCPLLEDISEHGIL